MYSQMLDPSSPLTWTATPLLIRRSEKLGSPGATVGNVSPLASLPLIWLLLPALDAIVTARTLPSPTARTNSDEASGWPACAREPPSIICTKSTSANRTPTHISRLLVQGLPG